MRFKSETSVFKLLRRRADAALYGLSRVSRYLVTSHVVKEPLIIKNYSPKWRWLAVDIYRAAKRRGKYPPLATDTEVSNCFSIH